MNIDWKVIDLYFNNHKYYLTQHHLESYNYFITNSIPYIIKTLNPFSTLKYYKNDPKKIKNEIHVFIGGENGDKIFLNKPFIYDDKCSRVLFPNEARLKDYNYISELFVDIDVKFVYHDFIKNGKTETKTEIKKYEKIKIGSIPIMLHSNICVLNNQNKDILTEMGECPFDQGGYFIIKGKEKVLISQERTTANRLFITESKDEKIYLDAVIRCTSDANSLFPKSINFAIYNNTVYKKCDSLLYKKPDSSTLEKRSCRKNSIVLTIPNIESKPLPLFIIFRALGIESDKSILEHIVGDINDPNNKDIIDFARYSLIDGNFLYTQSQCLEYLSHFTKFPDSDFVRYVLANDFLPNVGYDYKAKALFLGFLVNKLIKTQLNILPKTNRDNYIHKRIDLSGRLLTNIFRDFYNELRNNIKSTVDSIYNYDSYEDKKDISNIFKGNNLKKIFDHTFIEKGMIDSLKGSWGIDKKPEDSGIAQDLARLSYTDYVSHIRRINTPMDRSLKLVEPHRLSTSQYGYMCPYESPDGANIGLLKHLALFCNISIDTDKTIIENKLNDLEVINIKNIFTYQIQDNTKVFINNNWYGITNDPQNIVKNFKKFRANGEINFDVSISWNIKENEINILCDGGRCIRPLYIVKQDKTNNINKLLIDEYDNNNEEFSNFTWDNLIFKNNKKKNLIEYIDVEETNTILIAMTRQNLLNSIQPYTHCEIHPATVLSFYNNTIPFANKNQAPRVVFSGQQGKQAIGIYATNFNSRIDTASYILHYPHKALCHTRFSKYSHNEVLPNGQNVIVAIMCYTGYNQEDSIILNRSSIDKGLFNITSYKSLVQEENVNQKTGEKIIFGNPINMKKNGTNIDYRKANWETINEYGLPTENTYVHEGDVIVGMINQTDSIQTNSSDIFNNKTQISEYKDKSLLSSKILYGTIDKVLLYNNEEGLKKLKIRMRKMRTPVLGDKLGSKHGQKGVCGLILNGEDMPFTKDGITPDIIINPHAIPSRMTVAHLVESVLSKLCCLSGCNINATAFENHNIDGYYDILSKKYNYNRHGNEILYNGFTGQQIPTEIFIGPTYYYRFKHMVQDKMNSRDKGPKTALAHQPVQGRANEGGLRIGRTFCLSQFKKLASWLI
jgi:DNA-directed RNA polymerase II subunit RPB2